jgi:hypothetical protein
MGARQTDHKIVLEHASTCIINYCNVCSFSAQSWFEAQQAAEGEEKEVEEVPSVCAGENPEDTSCAVCQDKFEQFYNEEKEEWHLRAAVRVDGKTYHPLCYDDYKVSTCSIMLHILLNTAFKCAYGGHSNIPYILQSNPRLNLIRT